MTRKDRHYQKQLEWLKSCPRRYKSVLEAIGEYNHNFHYVGPQRWSRKVRSLLRRVMFLCDINICGYIHDGNYRKGESLYDKLKADAMFFGMCVFWVIQYEWPGSKTKFIGPLLGGVWRFPAMVWIFIYFLAVYYFGMKSFNSARVETTKE